jgi:hypothetical protein
MLWLCGYNKKTSNTVTRKFLPPGNNCYGHVAEDVQTIVGLRIHLDVDVNVTNIGMHGIRNVGRNAGVDAGLITE